MNHETCLRGGLSRECVLLTHEIQLYYSWCGLKPNITGHVRSLLVSAIVFDYKDGGWVELQPRAPPR